MKTDKGLHPRNVHNVQYDFKALIKVTEGLSPFVHVNAYGDLSIDFSNAEAVLMLNRALLAYFYGVKSWDIPKNYLCPPIPGRADYLHYMADLLAEVNGGEIPRGEKVMGLDVGVGANCIYPIVASSVYGWSFVGSEVDATAIKSAEHIVAHNEGLKTHVSIREQVDSEHIFTNIMSKKDRFALTLCNPPFHRSAEEASMGTQRKNRNLGKNTHNKKALNFGGQANELWCAGGEVAFIKKMITESVIHKKKVLFFSTLVSKKESLNAIYKHLKAVKPLEVKTLEMKQGQKVTRIVVWTFQTKKSQALWFKGG